MKNKILKFSILFLMLPTIALANETKHSYRLPIAGVLASPTFGMNQLEKEEYVENVEMCKNESTGFNSEYNESTNRTYVYVEGALNYSKVYTYLNGTRVFIFNTRDYRQSSDSYVTETIKETMLSKTDKYRVGDLVKTGTTRTSSNFPTWFFELIYDKKTDNYDWCQNNGFKTLN